MKHAADAGAAREKPRRSSDLVPNLAQNKLSVVAGIDSFLRGRTHARRSSHRIGSRHRSTLHSKPAVICCLLDETAC
jgi:hypothetical protein